MTDTKNADSLAELITAILDDNKGKDIVNLDVRELTDVTDRIIICSATSTRHAHTLAEKARRGMREHGFKPFCVEGKDAKDDWVLLDFLDVVVHVMLPETREFYSLEKLWGMTEQERQKKAANE